MKKEIISDKVQYIGWLFFILGILTGALWQKIAVVPNSTLEYFLSASAIGFLGLGIALILYCYIIRGIIHSFRVNAIRAKGIKATAIVEEIELGGKMDGLGNESYPAVRLRVLVNDKSGKKFYTQIDTTIALTHMSRFQPGAVVEVAYDPEKLEIAALLTPTKQKIEICLTQDSLTQWVFGYTSANPEQAAVTGYNCDIKSGSLTKLPTLSNFNSKKVQSVIPYSSDLDIGSCNRIIKHLEAYEQILQ